MRKLNPFLKNIEKKGFFNLLSANILIQIVSFASQLFVAGILSPEDVGRIKILQTWLSIFSIIGSMGFASSTLKLCSENRSEKETNSVFKAGIIFTLLSTVSAYVFVVLLNFLGFISQDNVIKCIVPLALFPLISNALLNIFVSYYQAKREIKLISNITSFNKILAVLLIVGFTFLMGIKGYYIGLNLATILLITVVFFIAKRDNLFNKQHSFSLKPLFHLHWNYARPSFLAVLLADLTAYADILIINYLMVSDIKNIGFYSFALTLTVAVRVLPATVQQITIPYFSSFSNDKIRFVEVFKRYSKLLILIVLGTLFLILVVTSPVIHLLFKGKYDYSMIYFYPLAVGWSIRQYNQIQAAALFGAGAISKIAYSQFFSLLINVVIILVSLYFWGILGVAYSSILCAAFEVLIFKSYVNKFIRN